MPRQIQVAKQIKQIFSQTPGVVDVDWYVEDPQTKYRIEVDGEKAALHGISAAAVEHALTTVLHGTEAGMLHSQTSREEIPVIGAHGAGRPIFAWMSWRASKLTASDGVTVSLREDHEDRGDHTSSPASTTRT